MASSQAVAKRSSDAALMPPPPPPKRIKRPTKILDEDSYTEALSRIIARDFFPGLIETESQQEYLDALESRDAGWIASAKQKLTEVMTPGPDGRRLRGKRGTSMTPVSGLFGEAADTPRGWNGETPGSAVSTTSTSTSRTKQPEIDTSMSLSAFQAKYTSEDNESFYKLLDKQNTKKAEKYAWMWAGNKIPAARQIAYRNQQAQSQLLKDSQESLDGKQILTIEAADTRKAMPDTWKSRPDNNFMFNPSSIEDTLTTVQQRAEESSRAAPKAVVYDNTRLPAPATTTDQSVPESPSLSAVQDAIDGRPRLSASEGGYTGSETPRVNGYAFVDSEPSPEPEPQPASTMTDLSTISFGTVDKTPNPFTIKERSNREALHHRMVEKVAKGKRMEKLEKETKTPVPKFMSSPRVSRDGLTPAAQRLLGKVGARTPGGSSLWEGEGKPPRVRSGLGKAWTPREKTPVRGQR